jgi:hypothetical protein
MRILGRYGPILRCVYYILRLYSSFSRVWNADVGMCRLCNIWSWRLTRTSTPIHAYKYCQTKTPTLIFESKSIWRNRNSEATERIDGKPIDNTRISKYLTSMTLHRNTRIVHSPSSDTHAPGTIQTQQRRENTCSRGHAPCYNSSKCQRTIKSWCEKSKPFTSHLVSLALTYLRTTHFHTATTMRMLLPGSYLAYAYTQTFYQQVDKYSRSGLFSESR